MDGDDYTWDWHADLRAAGSLGGEVLGGDFGISEVKPTYSFVDVSRLSEADRQDVIDNLRRVFPSCRVEFLASSLQLRVWEVGPSGDWAGPGPSIEVGLPTEEVRYDVRTGPERSEWQVATALYALERQLVLMQQRLAAVEAELEAFHSVVRRGEL